MPTLISPFHWAISDCCCAFVWTLVMLDRQGTREDDSIPSSKSLNCPCSAGERYSRAPVCRLGNNRV